MSEGCWLGWRCPVCGDRLIHQGKRSPNESASVLGQAVHDRLPPQRFTFNDIDGAVLRTSKSLLRLLEHKSPYKDLGNGQKKLLTLLSKIIEHCKTCTQAHREIGLVLHSESGVFLVEGNPQDSDHLGAHKVTDFTGRRSRVFSDEENFLRWIPLYAADDPEYVRFRQEQTEQTAPPERAPALDRCQMKGCDRPVREKSYHGVRLCGICTFHAERREREDGGNGDV